MLRRGRGRASPGEKRRYCGSIRITRKSFITACAAAAEWTRSPYSSKSVHSVHPTERPPAVVPPRRRRRGRVDALAVQLEVRPQRAPHEARPVDDDGAVLQEVNPA